MPRILAMVGNNRVGYDKNNAITFLWQDSGQVSRYYGGVCLHGHTHYSEESLEFLPRYLGRVPGVRTVTDGIDFSRAFFTPPLTPAAAWELERRQITDLNLDALISLTDHDNVEAGMALRAQGEIAAPISVEWTAPYQRSIFHLGIHNLPETSARSWMAAMAAYTASPDESLLPQILGELAALPETLIVLNHPFWLEEGIAPEAHPPALNRLLRECVASVHAFELNGTRRWSENAAAIELAQEHGRPTVSGGDRHACEPAACLNLTNARSFSEFATEVREGHSSVLFMPHYRQAMALRLFEAACDMLRPYPEYPGRAHWMDRFFYRSDGGRVRSLATLWKKREPWLLRPATGALQFLATAGVRGVLRSIFSGQAEVLP